MDNVVHTIGIISYLLFLAAFIFAFREEQLFNGIIMFLVSFGFLTTGISYLLAVLGESGQIPFYDRILLITFWVPFFAAIVGFTVFRIPTASVAEPA